MSTKDNADVLDPDVIMSHIEEVLSGATNNVCLLSIRTLSATLDVKHVVEQQCFTVSDESRHVQAVRLFPKESCTCPSETTCCHILAVRRSVGLQKVIRKPLNLSKLRRNSRYIKITTLLLLLKNLWPSCH